jgi:hypothetical protein
MNVFRYGSTWLLCLAFVGCDRPNDRSSNTTQASTPTTKGEMTRLATNSFEIVLLGTWKIETLKNPATVFGPSGECLMINSAVISGGGSEEDFQAVRDALQQNAEDAIRSAAADPKLRISSPLKKELTPNGLFAELHCKSTDGQRFFSEFSIAGPTTLVFATVEGPSNASSSVDLVRNAIMSIQWSQPFRPK